MIKTTDFARGIPKFSGFEATLIDQAHGQNHRFRSRHPQILGFRSHLDRSGSGSKPLISLEASPNSGVSKPPGSIRLRFKTTDFVRGIPKFWGFEATWIDQAQVQNH